MHHDYLDEHLESLDILMFRAIEFLHDQIPFFLLKANIE
jgi:hypothetical protein